MEPTLTLDRIAGHRVWAVIPHPGDRAPVLASVSSDGIWSEPSATASCRVGTHVGRRLPVVECSCGVYAGKDRVTPPWRRLWAQGPVEMWGRVIEGVTGYRAEHIRIAGDLDIVVGMGPGAPRCTTPGCRESAVGVIDAGRSFVARCDVHGRGSLVDFDAFGALVRDAFRRRYGVGAALLGEVAG